MSVSVVTSFSAEGYELYGKRCLDTFHQYWPKEVVLHIVSEHKIDLPQFEDRKVIGYNLYQESMKARDFYLIYGANEDAHGRGKIGKDRKLNRHWRTGYSFRHDAIKFSKKVFAIRIAAANTSSGRLIWLDADTITLQPIPLALINHVSPDSAAISYFDRSPYHSECGFVVYNLDILGTRHFIRRFADLYYSGKVFELAEWHDSWVFDWLRKHSDLPEWQIPHNNSGEPVKRSVLGQYLDHLKGARKTATMA